MHISSIHAYIVVNSITITKMTCKGICVRYKAQKPVGTGRYASGQRRCQICEIFIKWEGLWCPCCGYRLRTKPRNLKYKAKLRARVEADSIEAQAIANNSQEVETIAVASKTKSKTKAKAKTAKTKKSKSKEKTPCTYCEKLFVFIDKHEKKCTKNPNVEVLESQENESIAIKA
jgi:spore germination protein YaaH